MGEQPHPTWFTSIPITSFTPTLCFKLKDNIYLLGVMLSTMVEVELVEVPRLCSFKYCINERKWKESEHPLPYHITERCYVATDKLETIAVIIHNNWLFNTQNKMYQNFPKVLTFSENEGFKEFPNMSNSLQTYCHSFMFVRVK